MTQAGSSWLRFTVATALIVAAGVFLQLRGGIEDRAPRQPLSAMPMQLGDWVGREIVLSDRVRQLLGDGEFLQRIYSRSPDEPTIDFFAAYFATQRTGNTVHSPQNCLPGAGWTPVSAGRRPLRQPDGKSVIVNRYIIAKGLDRMLVLYWYQSHGRVVASEYWAKIYLVLDAMRMNRSDGALVRVTTPILRDESVKQAEQRAADFAQDLLPKLDNFIPR